jgi:hypothetical protein
MCGDVAGGAAAAANALFLCLAQPLSLQSHAVMRVDMLMLMLMLLPLVFAVQHFPHWACVGPVCHPRDAAVPGEGPPSKPATADRANACMRITACIIMHHHASPCITMHHHASSCMIQHHALRMHGMHHHAS